MAMDAKMEFLNQLEQRLSVEITAEAMNKALRAASWSIAMNTTKTKKRGKRNESACNHWEPGAGS